MQSTDDNQDTTTVQRRTVLYRRVSSPEQVANYSMETQRDALTAYAHNQNFMIVMDYEDAGVSAWHDSLKYRPSLARLLADAASDVYDDVLVYDVERWSRSAQVGLTALSTLRENNKRIIFVTQPDMNPNTPEGKFWTTLGLAMAQYYSDRLSVRVTAGKAQRRKAGLYNGFLPFGAIKGRNGIPIPDMTRRRHNLTNYDGYIKILELAASGLTSRQIAETLNYLGYRTTGNRGRQLFTKDSVTAILNSKFYLGHLPDGRYGLGHSRRGTYTEGIIGVRAPFVDEILWANAQQALQANSTRKRGHPVEANSVHAYSLQGLLYCSHCGGKIHMHTTGAGVPRVYCYSRAQGSRPSCAQRGVALEVYEPQVENCLRLIAVPQTYQSAVKSFSDKDSDDIQGAQRQLRTLTASKKRLVKQYQHGDLSEKVYRREVETVDYKIGGLVTTDDERPARITRLATYLQDLSAAWRAADPAQQQRLASELFEQIYIEDGVIVGFLLRGHAESTCGDYFYKGPVLVDGKAIDLYLPADLPTPLQRIPPISNSIPDDKWPSIALRNESGVGLRTLAREFNTSHETIRQGLGKFRHNNTAHQAA